MKKRTRAPGDETLEAYLREISTFPLLTPEEERHLGRRIRRHRDQHAFRRLVESNLRFVVGLVVYYTCYVLNIQSDAIIRNLRTRIS